jgi:hypothetical protein
VEKNFRAKEEMTDMTRFKAIPFLICAGLVCLILAPTAHPDAWNKKTKVTFAEPVEIPGEVVLQPGSYVLKLADSASNRHIVQVMNAEENRVYATILAVPNQRMRPAENTVIDFYETPAGEPKFLRAWFYPGDTLGQEFAYPKQRAMHIARAASTNVPVAPDDRKEEVTTAVSPGSEEVALSTRRGSQDSPTTDKSRAAEEEPRSIALNDLTSQRGESGFRQGGAGRLPDTASSEPLLALAGLLCLGAAVAVRVVARGYSG